MGFKINGTGLILYPYGKYVLFTIYPASYPKINSKSVCENLLNNSIGEYCHDFVKRNFLKQATERMKYLRKDSQFYLLISTANQKTSYIYIHTYICAEKTEVTQIKYLRHIVTKMTCFVLFWGKQLPVRTIPHPHTPHLSFVQKMKFPIHIKSNQGSGKNGESSIPHHPLGTQIDL